MWQLLLERRNNMNYKKSTLVAYTQASQTVLTDENLTFANSQKTGCAINFVAGGSTITLAKPGLYKVNFNAYGVESGTAGTVVLQLYANNNAVGGAVASDNSTSTTDVENLGFSTIIEVLPSCCMINNTIALTVQNTGVGATYGNTNIVVTKIA